MRISGWSSDVCSSDLLALVGAGHGFAATTVIQQRIDRLLQHALFVAQDNVGRLQFQQALQTIVAVDDAAIQVVQIGGREAAAVQRHQGTQVGRSEEHTSELQSLMRISYAVFCLKKKMTYNT